MPEYQGAEEGLWLVSPIPATPQHRATARPGCPGQGLPAGAPSTQTLSAINRSLIRQAHHLQKRKRKRGEVGEGSGERDGEGV